MADRTESVIARTIQHVKVHLRLTNPEKASSVMGEPQGNLGNHRQSFKWHKKSSKAESTRHDRTHYMLGPCGFYTNLIGVIK